MQITLTAQIGNLALLNAFLAAELDKVSCPDSARQELFLCVEEIFVNITSYAYNDADGGGADSDGNGEMTLLMEWNAATREMWLQFSDSGKLYNPLQRDDPDITLTVEERPIGGLGVFLVKQLTDSIIYENREGKNVLTITKRIAAEN